MSAEQVHASSMPGVVDLRDLASRYAWSPLAIRRFVEAAKLAPDGPPLVSFAPPRVVVAVVPLDDAAMLARSRAWLNDAARVIVVRAEEGSVAAADPILREVVEHEWRDAIGTIDVPVEVVDWRRDEDVDVVVRHSVSCAELRLPAPVSPAPPPIVEHAPGQRIRLDPMPSWVSPENIAQTIAARLVASGTHVMLYGDDGAIDLRSGVEIRPFRLGPFRRGVTPDGRPLVRDRNHWHIGSEQFDALGYFPLGFDGHHPVGWTGVRMHSYWLYSGTHGIGFLSASDHDFPCGRAKKLYNYKDNDPIGVSLAPQLDAVAYRFEHDVLVTTAIPIAWRAAGTVLVADFPRDPSRAVVFAQTPDGFGASSPPEDPLSEDARDQAPAFVLGPTSQARYAVDLTHTVYRITSAEPNVGAVARVGGPGEGFAVFDDEHRLVRRASGRLLDGWWRWATIVEAGAFWREDLATGERHRIAAVEGRPLVAVGVPWTKNVVVVFADGDDRWIALV